MADPADDAPFQNTDALTAERPLHPSSHSTCSNPWLATVLPIPQNETETIDHIPGEPTVRWSESKRFLQGELATPVLDELFHDLWLFAKKSSGNIDALHRQIIKGRDILPTEDPKLHLVWQEKRIFIKPIPLCLFCRNFWRHSLCFDLDTMSTLASCSGSHAVGERPLALGFLRSYAFLIQHHSDLQLAKKCNLVPEDFDWTRWSKFIAGFRSISNEDVAKRYSYGQLRLSRLHWATRLNWVGRIFCPKNGRTFWFYEEPYWSTVPYIRDAAVPLAFTFAGISLILSSMQVMLAVPTRPLVSIEVSKGELEAVQLTFWRFSIAISILSGLCLALLVFIPSIVLFCQLSWAIWHRLTGENRSRSCGCCAVLQGGKKTGEAPADAGIRA
jgi:hypothetical protein